MLLPRVPVKAERGMRSCPVGSRADVCVCVVPFPEVVNKMELFLLEEAPRRDSAQIRIDHAPAGLGHRSAGAGGPDRCRSQRRACRIGSRSLIRRLKNEKSRGIERLSPDGAEIHNAVLTTQKDEP